MKQKELGELTELTADRLQELAIKGVQGDLQKIEQEIVQLTQRKDDYLRVLGRLQGKPDTGPTRIMSEDARARISAAQKKRWAKIHRDKRKTSN